MLAFFFRRMTVDAAIRVFAETVRRLEAVASHHEDRRVDVADRIDVLNERYDTHVAEAVKARSLKAKIEALLAA